MSIMNAKEKLLAKYRSRPWFNGAGIAPTPDKSSLQLRLNVSPGYVETGGLPKTFEGFPLEVVVMPE